MESHFNQIEELVGTYPSGDGLRNAIYALIENKCPLTAWELLDADAELMTEVMGREYEATIGKGTHIHMGVNGQGISCSYAMEWGYTFGVECDTPTK